MLWVSLVFNELSGGFCFLKIKPFTDYYNRNFYLLAIFLFFLSLNLPEYTIKEYFNTNGPRVETGTVILPGYSAFCMLLRTRKIQD